MTVGSVTNFRGNSQNLTTPNANYYESLKKRRHQAVGLGVLGMGTAGAAYFVKNPYVSFAVGVIGLLGGILGLNSCMKANKEISEFEKQVKFNQNA